MICVYFCGALSKSARINARAHACIILKRSFFFRRTEAGEKERYLWRQIVIHEVAIRGSYVHTDRQGRRRRRIISQEMREDTTQSGRRSKEERGGERRVA